MKLGAGSLSNWRLHLSLRGDKSLSHRALMLAALARGRSRLRGLARGQDVASTAACLEQLGAVVDLEPAELGLAGTVDGWGPAGPQEPQAPLDCGNSGTTLRLLTGLLAGFPGLFVLHGDASLSTRPQARIVEPLRRMGAAIWGRDGHRKAPLVLCGSGSLQRFEGRLEVASAQVKSALLLAALSSGAGLSLEESGLTRDHTERMLRSLGVPLRSEGLKVHLDPGRASWEGFELEVPGDPSSAAFLVAMAVLHPDAEVELEGVSLNPTRLGFFRLLRLMGAEVEWAEEGQAMGEPVGRIKARSSELRGIEVDPVEVPQAIDELPLLAVLATAAEGVTAVRGAGELRVKESDRIGSLCRELQALGADIEEADDGFTVRSGGLQGGRAAVHSDHRLEMSLAVAALRCRQPVELVGAGWASVSFPEFWSYYPGVRGA